MSILEESGLRLAAAVAVGTICTANALRERKDVEARRVWLVFGGVMVLLALGHAVNAGGNAAESGRAAFRLEGIYENRRPVQLAAVVVLMVIGAFGTFYLATWLQEPWRRRFALPAVALWLLLGFLAVRTISYHDIDVLLYDHHPLGAHPGSLVELGGILLFGGLVLWATPSSTRRPRRSPPPLSRGAFGPGAMGGRLRPQREPSSRPERQD